MKQKLFFIFVLNILYMISICGQIEKPPLAKVQIETKEYHGVKIDDPYSYMQNFNDERVQNWVNENAEYGRNFLDNLPNREKLKVAVTRALTIERELMNNFREKNNKYYYKKTKLPENQGKIYVREKGSINEKVLFDPVEYKSASGKIYDINTFDFSQDGNLVLIDLFPMDGSEINEAVVLNLKANKVLADTLKEIEGGPAILPDGSGVYYSKAKIENGKKINSDFNVFAHNFGINQNNDKMVFSLVNNPELNLSPNDWLWVQPDPLLDYSYALAWGVTYGDIYITSTKNLKHGKAEWKKIFDKEDKVLNFYTFNNSIYVLTQKNGLNGEVLKTSLEEPDLSNADVIIPLGNNSIQNMVLANNNLYFSGRDVMKGILGYVNLNDPDKKVNSISLPYSGLASIWQYEDQPGIYFNLNSWIHPTKEFYYDPSINQSKEIKLFNNEIDLSFLDDYAVEEIEIKARDGIMVPLSLIHKKNMKKNGNNFVDMYGYGSYGNSIGPYFIGGKLPELEEGFVLAYTHVRGGGEKGEAWHLAGMKQNKPNTWRDFIDCAEYLIDNKITSKGKIACRGGSAGGILIGMAITERPDLLKLLFRWLDV